MKKVQVKSPKNWGAPPKPVANPLYQYMYPVAADVEKVQKKLGDKVNSLFLTSTTLNSRALPNTCRHSLAPAVTAGVEARSDHASLQRTLLMVADPNNDIQPKPTPDKEFKPGADYDRNTFRYAGMRAKIYACLTQTLDADEGLAYCRFATKHFEGVRKVPKPGEPVLSGQPSWEPRSIESYHDDLHAYIAHGAISGSLWGTMVSSSGCTTDRILMKLTG